MIRRFPPPLAVIVQNTILRLLPDGELHELIILEWLDQVRTSEPQHSEISFNDRELSRRSRYNFLAPIRLGSSLEARPNQTIHHRREGLDYFRCYLGVTAFVFTLWSVSSRQGSGRFVLRISCRPRPMIGVWDNRVRFHQVLHIVDHRRCRTISSSKQLRQSGAYSRLNLQIGTNDRNELQWCSIREFSVLASARSLLHQYKQMVWMSEQNLNSILHICMICKLRMRNQRLREQSL